MWCQFLSEWVVADYFSAVYLFLYKHGQVMMNAIFGKEKKSDPELFSPRNSMIIEIRVEKKFDRGLFTIVPLVSDEPSKAEMAA